MRCTALLLAALGPGRDATFGTLTPVRSGVEAGAAIAKGAPPTGEDRPENEPGGD